MRRFHFVIIATIFTAGCGGTPSAQSSTAPTSSGSSGEPEATQTAPEGDEESTENEFQLRSSDTAEQAHGERPSEIEATETHAAMRLFVVHPEDGPIEGIVIKMTAPDGTAYYTEETDSHGYAEVLVPVGQRYEMEYLSLGRRNTMANVEVPEGPNQDIRLTMRYRRERPEPRSAAAPAEPQGLVLEGILFDSGRATIQQESFPRLDRVVEYMRHRPSVRIRISGHTDNVGNPRRNQALSEARAEAVKSYLVSHGIDESRIEAVGYGDERPVAPNDTEAGRAQNRRIEAVEL